MITVFKYKLKVNAVNRVKMPMASRALDMIAVRNDVYLFAEVDTEAALTERKFEVYGTGHELPPRYTNRSYVGTTTTNGGGVVWHGYERIGKCINQA